MLLGEEKHRNEFPAPIGFDRHRDLFHRGGRHRPAICAAAENRRKRISSRAREIPRWAMGLSVFATIISSITFIAYPGAAFKGDWNQLVPGFMAVGVLFFVGPVLISFFRHAVGMSAYEYFEKRFGYGARAYSALAFAAGHFSKMGFVLFTVTVAVCGMTGWDKYHVILGAGVRDDPLHAVWRTGGGHLDGGVAGHRQARRRDCGSWRFAFHHARRRRRGVSSGERAKQIQPRQLSFRPFGQRQFLGDAALRHVLVSAKIRRRPDAGAALSRRQIRPRRVERRGVRRDFVRAGVDCVHARRDFVVGILPAFRGNAAAAAA